MITPTSTDDAGALSAGVRQDSRRVVVTGGSGFIGSALVRHLIAEGHFVCNVDLGTYAAVPGALHSVRDDPRYSYVECDIADRSLLRRTISTFAPDIIFNLAAESHVDRSIDEPLQFVHTNVTGAATLLLEALEYWIASGRPPDFRLVQVSTDEVFGSIIDGSFGPSTPYNPRSPYAASKAAADHLARAWHHTYGLPTIVTNCSNNYGPFQFPEKLIPLITISALDGRTLPVYGDGLHVRDWIHVDDHVDGLVAAWHRGVPGNTYLFGAREERTNLEVVETICGIVDELVPDSYPTAARIEMVDDRPGHDRRYSIDPTTTEESLAWSAVTAFDVGVQRTVHWYAKTEDWWRPLLEHGATRRMGTP